MSELRTYDVIMTPSSDGSWVLKSEAYKVLAEKDKKIDLYKRGWKESDRINEYLYAQLRHSSRKRCLAMAKWCDACRFAWSFIPEDDEVHKSDFYDKWKLRWLELAEKFKEAK